MAGHSRFEDRSRALGCLILAVLALIIVTIVFALGWRSMWWRDSVPHQPQTRLSQEASPEEPTLAARADQMV
jgi:hypothetical protein